MKASLFKGVQFRILKAFMCSILLSAILTIFLLFRFLKTAYNVEYSTWGEWTNTHLNETACILIIFFIIFVLATIVFFYIFTRKLIHQLSEINKKIALISDGNFDISIPVTTKDEIGEIAGSINVMSQKLDELIKKDKESEKIKNDMISNISHDLRTPLTSVIGYVEIMQKEEYKDKATVDNCIDVILKKCAEMKNLVEDLLEYTSINFRGGYLKEENISIIEIVEQVMIGFIPTLEENDMSFAIKAPEEKVVIIGDTNLIVRLFENIINNSIFYGKDGGKIDVEIKTAGNMVSTKVINYGPKIAEEDQAYVFERFYRGEKSRNVNTGGKGMGLAIAKSIADAHKGTIKVTSSEEKTSFEILLPVNNKKL